MPVQCYSDQQVPINIEIGNSLRRPNPPILENIHCSPIRPFGSSTIGPVLKSDLKPVIFSLPNVNCSFYSVPRWVLDLDIIFAVKPSEYI
jgi:hypothetical protein